MASRRCREQGVSDRIKLQKGAQTELANAFQAILSKYELTDAEAIAILTQEIREYASCMIMRERFMEQQAKKDEA